MFDLNPYWLMWIALGLSILTLLVSVGSAVVSDDPAASPWPERKNPVPDDAATSVTSLSGLG
jgi:hypothetical protein